MIICGVDEAGRGPVIGPLVIAAVCFDESKLGQLAKLKVRDSKILSSRRRTELANKIKKIAKAFEIVTISAQEIDSRAAVGLNLNQLEALKISEIINKLKPDIVYIDSPTSPRPTKFAELIRAHLERDAQLIAKHKADEKYPVVAAASILAKITRDREISRIKEEVGFDFGSGYPSDKRTMAFLKEHWENELAKYIRKSWGTIKELRKKKFQRTLDGF